MTFTILTWQQGLATAAFFFVGAFCWCAGSWCFGHLAGRVK